jgi:benzoyl-CoA reductase subunit D
VTTIGLDIGGRNVQGVAVADGQVVASAGVTCGFEPERKSKELVTRLLNASGLARDEVEGVAATGMGREAALFADWKVTEVSCVARASRHLFPGVEMAVDVGAEESRAVLLSSDGKVLDSSVNDRCAAGSGAFVESMARALNMNLAELGDIGCGEAGGEVSIDTQCVVFAESEVISLVHRNTPPDAIARAVYDSIASRVSVMVRRLGVGSEASLFGGMALGKCFRQLLADHIGVKTLHVPQEPQYGGALGAALVAADRVERG